MGLLDGSFWLTEDVVVVWVLAATCSPDAVKALGKFTWAMKTTVTASKKAVPFMLTVAPRGNTKRAIGSLMPCSEAQRSVTGRLAMLESVANTVTSACANALQSGQVALSFKQNCVTQYYFGKESADFRISWYAGLMQWRALYSAFAIQACCAFQQLQATVV